MKALFIHDHKFIYNKIEYNCYYSGKFSNKSFERYFNHFSSLTIISRTVENSNVDGLNLINDKRINFISFDDQSNMKNRFFKRKKYKEIIFKIIENYDAVIIRLPSEIGFLAANVCYENNIPFVCEVVACPVDSMRGFGTLKSKLYSPIIKNEMKKSVERACGALYVTDCFLQKRYPNNGFSVSASNVDIFKVSTKFKKKSDAEIGICLIGNLDSEHKGYPVLYKALDYLDKSSNLKFKMYLVGSGSKYKIENKFNNINLEFTGSLKNDDVHSLLEDKIDIYVQPSNQEGLPRATIEAMSHAIPCIVSDAGGLSELIDKKYVHLKSDYKKLANCIISLLSSKEEYYQQSFVNSKKSENFLSDKLIPLRLKFYNEYIKLLSEIRK